MEFDDKMRCCSKVYDITAFLWNHPGGQEVLLPWAGKDATEAFATAHKRPVNEQRWLRYNQVGTLAAQT